MTPLNTVISRLAWLLRLHYRGGLTNRSMPVTILPLKTPLQFEGVSLSRIMSPAVPSDPFECEVIFDTFMSPIMNGEGTHSRDLAVAGGGTLRDFVLQKFGDPTSLKEATTRLLFALGNAEGAELRYGKDHIAVAHGDRIYGVKSGVVFSRFCDGFDLGGPFDPREFLDAAAKIRITSPSFCSLYREAYKHGHNAVEALLTLYIGQPNFKFKKMAEYTGIGRYPSEAKLGAWEKTLLNRKDPISVIYKKLVPVWMTPGQFAKIFGRAGGRPLAPSGEQTAEYIAKLHAHFYKPKKERIKI